MALTTSARSILETMSKLLSGMNSLSGGARLAAQGLEHFFRDLVSHAGEGSVECECDSGADLFGIDERDLRQAGRGLRRPLCSGSTTGLEAPSGGARGRTVSRSTEASNGFFNTASALRGPVQPHPPAPERRR